MVSENHPNKCPHICLHLTVKQQTCRSGKPLAGGVTPAKAAHYTYRLKPCKPFLKKVLGPEAGAETGSKLLRGAAILTTAQAGRKAVNPAFSGSLGHQPTLRFLRLQRGRNWARRNRQNRSAAKTTPYTSASPTSERASQNRCSHARTVAG